MPLGQWPVEGFHDVICVYVCLQQWEAAHHRVVGRLEESPMTDVVTGGGGGGGGVRTRADSLEMIDLGKVLDVSSDKSHIVKLSAEDRLQPSR